MIVIFEFKMKVFVVFCLFIGSLQVRGASLSTQQKQILNRIHKDCLEESKVNEIVVDKAKQGIYSDDLAFKNYLYCFSQRVGIQDDKGVIQKDVFERQISRVVDDEALMRKIVEQCTVQQDSPQETSLVIAKCMREVAPNLPIYKVAPEIISLSEEKVKKLLQTHRECAAQSALDEREIEEAYTQNTLFRDPKYKNYLYCNAKKEGIQREDGSIDREVFTKCFRDVIEDPAVVERLMEKCTEEKDTPEDTAYFLSKCIHENSLVHIDPFPNEIEVLEHLNLIMQHSKACVRKTGISKEIIDKANQGIDTEDPQLKAFFFCMDERIGFLNEAGDFQFPVIHEKAMNMLNDSTVTQKLIDQCALSDATQHNSEL